MATIILSHDVEDFSKWKPLYDADSERRTAAGLKELSVGTKSGDPNKVYVIWEGDAGTVDKMMQDPELAEKMKEAGVVSEPEVIIIDN